MLADDGLDELEQEVRELILNSKLKKTTVFEPCNEKNLMQYLRSIQEELSLCGIKYVFDPKYDLSGGSNFKTDSVVRLVNSLWKLIMQHKEMSTNAATLKERNYALQQNNFYLNNLTDSIKKQLETCEKKLKRTEELARRSAIDLDVCRGELSKTSEELRKAKRRTASVEDQSQKSIKKLELDYTKLRDRAGGSHGGFISKVESDNLRIEEYKNREKKFRDTIATLQESNRRLISEIVNANVEEDSE